jgi:hypothetical protein
MSNIRIESGNGRSIHEETQTAMGLLDNAGIPYGVNISVADADENAATLFLRSARIQFTAGKPLRDSLKNRVPNLPIPKSI